MALLIGATFLVARAPWSRSRGAWPESATDGRRLLVLPFHIDPAIHDWDGTAFEDSLAARLAANTGLVTRAGTLDPANADYVLEGTVMPDRGRYVITLQLRPAGQRAATWTATFWRQVIADTSVVRDLALAVTEALGPTRR